MTPRRCLGALVLCVAMAGACAGDPSRPGAGGPGASPAPATSAPALPYRSTRWDDGMITLADGAPTRDWGVVAAPTQGGPYPVALVFHGNHPTCPTDTGEGRTWPCPEGTEQPNQEGLTYLLEALARRGFVAVAPGVNVQYTLGAGEPAPAVRTAQLGARALQRLTRGELGVDPARVDDRRLVLLGHSMGGEDAGLLASGRQPFAPAVSGVVMLQPALNVAASLPLVDKPSAIVISECDGDTGVVGGRFVAEALTGVRRTPAALVVLEHANHNSTNANLRPEGRLVNAPACDPDRLLTPEAQRAALAETVPELAHAVLADGAGAGWAGRVFDEPAPPPGVQLGVVRAGEPVAPLPGSGPALPAGLQLQGMTATFCPAGYYTPYVAPGTEPCHRPELPMLVGLPQTLALSWDRAGASLTMAVDAAPGAVVRLRVIPDPADPRLTGPLRLRLSAGGQTTEIDVPVPAVRREEAPPFTLTFGLAMWTTASLPVPSGAATATLEVLGPQAGSMQVASLGPA